MEKHGPDFIPVLFIRHSGFCHSGKNQPGTGRDRGSGKTEERSAGAGGQPYGSGGQPGRRPEKFQQQSGLRDRRTECHRGAAKQYQSQSGRDGKGAGGGKKKRTGSV